MQLRECPFCGGDQKTVIVMVSDCERAIRCWGCGSQGPSTALYAEHSDEDNESAAAEKWNARASDSRRCGSCRHWRPTERFVKYGRRIPKGFGKCESGHLLDASDSSDASKFDVPSSVLYTDHEDGAADSVTRADFGCVLWEKA